jgi:hypothetical protein
MLQKEEKFFYYSKKNAQLRIGGKKNVQLMIRRKPFKDSFHGRKIPTDSCENQKFKYELRKIYKLIFMDF